MRASEETGRLRVELSNCFKSKADESAWFAKEEISQLPRDVVKHLRKHGTEFIKEIPF